MQSGEIFATMVARTTWLLKLFMFLLLLWLHGQLVLVDMSALDQDLLLWGSSSLLWWFLQVSDLYLGGHLDRHVVLRPA
jgi:hypothetical protein